MKFDWQQADTHAFYRYDSFDGIVGVERWRALVERASSFAGPSERGDASIAGAFADFIAGLDGDSPAAPPTLAPHGQHRPTCCVFISHRRNDIKDALNIATHATQAGYDYWLDIHDPTLRALGDADIASPAKDILLAAAIEIALLNSTHVIALHTQHSIVSPPKTLSKWIPYELGRAKARQISSKQAACWFDQQTKPNDCGEYVYLVHHTYSLGDVDNWLASAPKDRCSVRAKKV